MAIKPAYKHRPFWLMQVIVLYSEVYLLAWLLFELVGKVSLFILPVVLIAWVAYWEKKIQSRPLHILCGYRMRRVSLRPLSWTRCVIRGFLHLLPFLMLSFRRQTLLERFTACEWYLDHSIVSVFLAKVFKLKHRGDKSSRDRPAAIR